MRGIDIMSAVTLGMFERAALFRGIHDYGRAPSSGRRIYLTKPPTNGKREVARRLRQIQNGQLQVSV